MTKAKKNIIFVVLGYLVIYLFIFHQYLFSSGIPVGIDWSFPVYPYQVKNWLLTSCYTWMQNSSAKEIFGSKLSFATGFYIQLISYLVVKLFHIGPAILQKIIILLTFLFGGLSTYFYLKKIGAQTTFAFLSGLIFTLNPVTFDFFLMGWHYSLLSFFSLPLILFLIHKFVESNKLKYLIYISLIFGAVGFLESQSVIHFFIFIAIYLFLVQDIKKISALKRFLGSLLIIFLISVSLHLSWILPALLVEDSYLASSVTMGDAWRFAIHFSLLNFIRGWGSVVNYFFEYSYPASLMYFSYLPPLSLILFIIMLIKKRLIKLDFFFLILFFYPLLMYWFSRNLAVYIPYSNVIRDFGRTYPFYFLAIAYSLKWLKTKNLFLIGIVYIIFIIFAWPYFDGSLYGVKGKTDQGISMYKIDQRLRLLNYQSDFEKIDQYLAQKQFNQKAWLLPSVGGFMSDNDYRFQGEWAGFWDIAPVLSSNVWHPLQTFDAKDKMKTVFDEYKNGFTSSQCSSEIKPLLQDLANHRIFYLLLRKNVSSVYNLSSNQIDLCLKNSTLAQQVFDYEDYKLYQIKIADFLPIFYLPQNISIAGDQKQVSGDQEIQATQFSSKDLGNEVSNEKNFTGTLEYKKINPSKYKIRINNAKGIAPIVFAENFHPMWKLYQSAFKKDDRSNFEIKKSDLDQEWSANLTEIKEYLKKGQITALGKNIRLDFISKNYHNSIQNNNLSNDGFYNTWFKKPIAADHYVANGYENSWFVDVDRLCSNNKLCQINSDGSVNAEITVEFWPQRLFYLGIALSGLMIISITIFLFIEFNQNRHVKKDPKKNIKKS